MTTIRLPLSVVIIAVVLVCLAHGQAEVSSQALEKSEEDHRVSSLNLFIFVCLLTLTVLTAWLFKHHRFRFIHETGLAVIYGLLVGVLIRYAGTTSKQEKVLCNRTYSALTQRPDVVILQVPANINASSYNHYQYNFYKGVPETSVQETELEEMATFDPEIFFNVLLPPIIFNAGFSMKRKQFFSNFGAIMTYAFLGTFISAFVTGGITYGFSLLIPDLGLSFGNCLWFGSIISATDPVTVLAIFNDLSVEMSLYIIVFGESVLNDAVAIILSGSVEKFSADGLNFGHLMLVLLDFLKVFFGAFFLGSAMGCLTAAITKYTRIKDYPLLETSLLFLMSYGTFLGAEAAGVTGIVSVLFCGVCQAHYTFNNLSEESQTWTKQLFELLNFLSESFVFCYVGITTFTYTHHNWDARFIFISLFAVLVARACNVYPLSFLLNLGRSNKIRYNYQHMMMFSGLRGAIAFALAIRTTDTDQERLIFTTTLVIVIVTVIACGGLTTPVLELLKIRTGVDTEATEMQRFDPVRTGYPRYNSTDEGASPSAPNPSASEVDAEMPSAHAGHLRLKGKAALVKKWYKLDKLFLKPLLTHSQPALTETMPKCCMWLAKLLTTEEQYARVDVVNGTDTTDMVEADEIGTEFTSNHTATSQGHPTEIDRLPAVTTTVHIPLPSDSVI